MPRITDELYKMKGYTGSTIQKVFKGGESEGLSRMDNYMKDLKRVREFEKPKTIPTRIDQPDTTGLSLYFKFGSLSIRHFYWKLQEIYKNGKHSSPPESLLGQIYFREWFYLISYKENSTFDLMVGNKNCK